MVLAAAIFGFGIIPVFSLGSAWAAWSYYGNYDFSRGQYLLERSDEDDTELKASDEIQEKVEDKNVPRSSVLAPTRERTDNDNQHAAPLQIPDFDSYDVDDPEYSEYLAKFKYVLYYGGFDSAVADAIIKVKPTLLITNYEAIGHAMRAEFANNNISVIAYLPIHWTDKPLESTLAEAKKLLADGADGLFIDEAATISTDWEYWYHGRIYETAKEYDKDAIVIINPGAAPASERAMQVTDIICFEHEWRDIANLSWASEYPGWRFMGISSNEFVKVMGYNVGAASAKSDLEEARSLNIAYHYSADHYIWLPSWLDVYGGLAISLHPVGGYVDLDLSPVMKTPGAAPSEQGSDNTARAPSPDNSTEGTSGEEDKGPSKAEDDESSEDTEEEPDELDSPRENKIPLARTAEDQYLSISEEEQMTVLLDGRGSRDPDSKDSNLSFSWRQTDGPEVDLKEADTAYASFVLDPPLFGDASELEFRFELAVSDADGGQDSDSTTIMVSVNRSLPDDEIQNDIGTNNTSESEKEPLENSTAINELPEEDTELTNSTRNSRESNALPKTESTTNGTEGAATP